ncbi:unnamed protein product [Moneuplotes crassus]|uniref:EamA domain-containing protein n=1 Tax=Euplotes crassus TaxID=5936 RepID=A0AAD1XAG7_EUPCR|nr:unnamed protein product [Moneuplotes crassus]
MSTSSFEVSLVQEEQQEKQPKGNNLWIGIVLTVLALCGGSSIIPFVDEYKGVDVVLRNIWRWQILVVYCLPCSVYFWYNSRKFIEVEKVFTRETWIELFVSALLWIFGSILYIWSSDFTLVSHSGLLGNLAGVFLVMVNIVRAVPVHRLEVYGTILVVISAIIFMNDNASTKTNGQTNILLGDIMSLCSAPIFGMYYVYNSRLLQKLPAMVILQISFTIQLVIHIVFYILVMKTDKFYSFDSYYGVLGWASDTYLFHSLVFIGISTGLFGVGGYVFTLNFFPPHIVGNIFLLEPVFAQSLGCILGQDNIPGLITYIGTIGITVGLGILIKGDLLNKQTCQDTPNPSEAIKQADSKSVHSSLIIDP